MTTKIVHNSEDMDQAGDPCIHTPICTQTFVTNAWLYCDQCRGEADVPATWGVRRTFDFGGLEIGYP